MRELITMTLMEPGGPHFNLSSLSTQCRWCYPDAQRIVEEISVIISNQPTYISTQPSAIINLLEIEQSSRQDRSYFAQHLLKKS